MKYYEAINGPDSKLWKAEVVKEHQRMVDSRVFKSMKKSEVPEGVKLIDTTWVMKKKSNGTLQGSVNISGFKQINGQHYDGTSIALSIMLIQGGIAHIVDIKGAFLYGEFKEGKKIYIKIPLGFERFYLSNTALLLKKML
jgi:hypothetical protein